MTWSEVSLSIAAAATAAVIHILAAWTRESGTWFCWASLQHFSWQMSGCQIANGRRQYVQISIFEVNWEKGCLSLSLVRHIWAVSYSCDCLACFVLIYQDNSQHTAQTQIKILTNLNTDNPCVSSSLTAIDLAHIPMPYPKVSVNTVLFSLGLRRV